MSTLPTITLKNVRRFPSMSEETECFEATVYVDGKKAGRVSNRGTGGSHTYDFNTRALDDALRAAAVKRTLGEGEEAITVDLDLDLAIDEALDRHMALTQMRLKVLALNPDNGQVYEFARRRGETKEAVEQAVRRQKPTYKLFVDMPEEEQLRLLGAA